MGGDRQRQRDRETERERERERETDRQTEKNTFIHKKNSELKNESNLSFTSSLIQTILEKCQNSQSTYLLEHLNFDEKGKKKKF